MAIGLGAAALAAGIGAAANVGDTFANWGINSWLNQQTQEQSLERMAQQYNYDKDLFGLQSQFNSAEAEKNRAWQQYMSNTAYQRAIQDMEKAGINPASLGGASLTGAFTPSGSSASAGLPNVGVSGASSANFRGSNMSGVISNLASSALYGMIAKDRDAARFLASEIQDNAKHAFKMQEIAEKASQLRATEDYKKQLNHVAYRDKNDKGISSYKSDPRFKKNGGFEEL